jgi:hypothetical protein
MITPDPNFAHLLAMTDEYGTYEHALYAAPRRELGYCTDDVARVLVVTARERFPTAEVQTLARASLRFVADAQGRLGDCKNRRDSTGTWRDAPSLQDCWGRSLWGLGEAVRSRDSWLSGRATNLFERGARQRSPWLRATAFAALGASAVLSSSPQNRAARLLLTDAAVTLDFGQRSPEWPWPEDRLSYADAAVVEAMIATGAALDKPNLKEAGLELLGWLLDRQMNGGHLSVTPVGGSGPGDAVGRFDQQPIEVAALAEACARAHQLTRDDAWAIGVERCMAWFLGANDVGAVMWDPETGGGYDGLEIDGPNRNQGAESTLAFIATCQLARSFRSVLQ